MHQLQGIQVFQTFFSFLGLLVNKGSRTAWLKQQRLILSQSWRPEGFHRAGPPSWLPVVAGSRWHPWPAAASLQSRPPSRELAPSEGLCRHIWCFPLWACLCASSPGREAAGTKDRGPTESSRHHGSTQLHLRRQQLQTRAPAGLGLQHLWGACTSPHKEHPKNPQAPI